jgi:ACS family glucarate transporter-like MFS transporter
MQDRHPETILREKPTLVRYQVLGWVCILSMITYIDRVCIKQVGSEMQNALGMTQSEFGFVLSIFFLSYAAFEIPSGWLGDRLGPRKVLIRIVLWWSVFTALTGCVWKFTLDSGYAFEVPLLGSVPLLLNGFVLLLIIRFLFGVGEAGAYPNSARALRTWFPYGRRGMAQGLLWMFARWGGAVAPLLVGVFASWLGWRGAFWAFGVLGILWVVCFAVFFRDSPVEHPSVNAAERELILGKEISSAVAPGQPSRTPLDPVEQPPLSWSTMLRSRTLWCLSLMYFCSNAGWCFFITWDVEYYKNVLGLSGMPLRLASGAPLFFGGIACLVGGFLTDALVRVLGRRWGRTLQGMISYAMGGTFFLLAVLTENPWLAVPSLCVASFLKDFAMAASWSTCLDVGHRYSGTVAGFMNTVGNLGSVVSPTIVAYLARHGAWELALVYSAAMFFTAAVGWAFINPKRVIVYKPEDRKRLIEGGV